MWGILPNMILILCKRLQSWTYKCGGFYTLHELSCNLLHTDVEDKSHKTAQRQTFNVLTNYFKRSQTLTNWSTHHRPDSSSGHILPSSFAASQPETHHHPKPSSSPAKGKQNAARAAAAGFAPINSCFLFEGSGTIWPAGSEEGRAVPRVCRAEPTNPIRQFKFGPVLH